MKKIISIILIICGIYLALIFLSPGTTDFIESHFASRFSVKVRAFKKVLDGKKTFSEFKEFIGEDNPNIKRYFETIDSSISGVKGSIDSIRKKALDTKAGFDENIQMVENGIKKIEDTKEKIEKISNILKDKPEENSPQSPKNIEKNEEIENLIDKKVEKKILKEENKADKIYYNPMGDISDF